MAVGLQEDFLGDVLGVVVVVGHPQGQVVHVLLMAFDEDTKGGPIPLPGSLEQFLLVGSHRAGGRFWFPHGTYVPSHTIRTWFLRLGLQTGGGRSIPVFSWFTSA